MNYIKLIREHETKIEDAANQFLREAKSKGHRVMTVKANWSRKFITVFMVVSDDPNINMKKIKSLT